MSSKKPKDGSGEWAEDQRSLGYYYDDAHGYEKYVDTDGLTIWTIGHSTRTFDEFIDLLRSNDIELVADVRSFPGSRKFPQFNRESLEESLPATGIEYVHLRDLGGRRKVRADSPHTVWRHPAFRGYADYMDTEPFEEGIERLLDLARDKKVTIMCSEAVWWRCHRSMISDYLKSKGVNVIHIMDGGNVEHPYTSAAKLVDGELVYGPAVDADLHS